MMKMADLNKDLKYEIDNMYFVALCQLGAECELRGIDYSNLVEKLQGHARDEAFGLNDMPFLGDNYRKREVEIKETFSQLRQPVENSNLEETVEGEDDIGAFLGSLDYMKASDEREYNKIIDGLRACTRWMANADPNAYFGIVMEYGPILERHGLLVDKEPVLAEESGLTDRKLHMIYIGALDLAIVQKEEKLKDAEDALKSYKNGTLAKDSWVYLAYCDILEDEGPNEEFPAGKFDEYLDQFKIGPERKIITKLKKFRGNQIKALEEGNYKFTLD